MTMISMTGLDLSFMYEAPAGGGNPPPRPRRKAKAKAPRQAEVIDFAALRKARGLQAKPLSKKARATLRVSPQASAKVRALAKELGIDLTGKAPVPRKLKRRTH